MKKLFAYSLVLITLSSPVASVASKFAFTLTSNANSDLSSYVVKGATITIKRQGKTATFLGIITASNLNLLSGHAYTLETADIDTSNNLGIPAAAISINILATIERYNAFGELTETFPITETQNFFLTSEELLPSMMPSFNILFSKVKGNQQNHGIFIDMIRGNPEANQVYVLTNEFEIIDNN